MTRYTAISFSEFVDRVTESCAPQDYLRDLTTDDKDEMLSSILCDLTMNLMTFSTRPNILRRIIDEHEVSPTVTIRMIQDAGVDFLLTKRGTLRNLFLKKMGQARDQVPMDAVEDMKTALRRIVKEKSEAVARANLSASECARLKQDIQELKTRCAKFQKLVQLLQSGKDIGPAATGLALRMPKPDRLAEPPTSRAPDHKRRERIAEPQTESSYDESDEGDGDEGDSDEGDSESVASSESGKKNTRGRLAPYSGRKPPRRESTHRESPHRSHEPPPRQKSEPASNARSANAASTVSAARAVKAPVKEGTSVRPTATAPTRNNPGNASKPKVGPVVTADFFRTATAPVQPPAPGPKTEHPASLMSLLSPDDDFTQ